MTAGLAQVVKYPVSAVHILKCHGLSLLDSKVEAGYALNCVRASQGMPTSVKGAKIACLDINLQRYKMQMGVQVSQSPRIYDPPAARSHLELRRNRGTCGTSVFGALHRAVF